MLFDSRRSTTMLMSTRRCVHTVALSCCMAAGQSFQLADAHASPVTDVALQIGHRRHHAVRRAVGPATMPALATVKCGPTTR